MKTSNKLLLAFVGLIVLLMLLSDTVMWANYKRGRTGDGLLTDDDDQHLKENVTPLTAFKVLKIEGRSDFELELVKADKFQLSSWMEKDKQFLYSVQNDTIFIKVRNEDHFALRCPSLQAVILSDENKINIRDFNLTVLNIMGGNSCRVQLFDMKVNKLDVSGGTENEFVVMGQGTQIDSITLKLGKSGTIRSYDIPYQHVSMNVDSLKELVLDGRSLTSMKQIQ